MDSRREDGRCRFCSAPVDASHSEHCTGVIMGYFGVEVQAEKMIKAWAAAQAADQLQVSQRAIAETTAVYDRSIGSRWDEVPGTPRDPLTDKERADYMRAEFFLAGTTKRVVIAAPPSPVEYWAKHAMDTWNQTHVPVKPKREATEQDKALHRAIGARPSSDKRLGAIDWMSEE